MDKVLSYAVVISPETVSFRVKRENLYKRPHIKSLRFFPSLEMTPHVNSLWNFSITGLIIKVLGRFQTFYKTVKYTIIFKYPTPKQL